MIVAAPWAPRLARLLLALALCLQSGLALAHCLRAMAGPADAALQVEICTTAGIVVLDLGGEEREAPPGPDHAGFCPACHGLPQVLLPEAPTATEPAVRPVSVAPATSDAQAPTGARAPPYASRAPPSQS